MSRIKIELPPVFSFTTEIPVRITDINYGGHVGNDAILSLIHEVRVQFLAREGYSEIEFGGTGLIMADAGIEFKSELFYGDTVIASVAIANIGRVNFDLFYRLEKVKDGKRVLVAAAKTGMICYDYTSRKISSVPREIKERFSQ